MEKNQTIKTVVVADQPPKVTPTKTRSPAYPAFDLETALNRAGTIWEKAKTHPVSLKAAADYWELPVTSSATLTCVATLKKFGLVEELEKGTDDERSFKLTEFGIRLVYNPDVQSGEHITALKQAALLPTIHKELWEKYKDNWPDDKVIERYLVLDRKFNQKYVSGLIEEFKRTIAFANLTESDTLPQDNEHQPAIKGVAPSVKTQFAPPGASFPPAPPAAAKSGEVPVFLGENRYARVPVPLSEEDYQLLLDQLKLLKKKLVLPVINLGEKE